MPFSPSDLEVLIHCHTCPEPHPRLDAPAVQDAIGRFLVSGLIRHSALMLGENLYLTTHYGQRFLEAVLLYAERLEQAPLTTKRVIIYSKDGEIRLPTAEEDI